MGARHARRIEEPIHEMNEKTQGPSTPREYRTAIDEALNVSVRSAHRLAAEGHARFPDDLELKRLTRLLDLPPARSVPPRRTRSSREKAYRWLDENEARYRGQWVALSGYGFLASAPTLDELLEKIEPIDPADPPLVHHIH